MSRSSDIDRAGVGGEVVRLAASGDAPSMIAAAVTETSGHDISIASVRRHLSKHSLNAATTPSETKAIEMLAAAIAGTPDVRDSATSSYFGLYKLNTTNIFMGYSGIARGMKNGQVLRGFKNIALKITNGATIIGDEKDAEKIRALASAIDFSQLLQNVIRSVCEMGTCIVGLKSDGGEFIAPRMLPMSYMSLLTEHETPGTVENALVRGAVTQIIQDEGGDHQVSYEREDVGLFRIWADDTELVDIKGRNTYGIYGESMTLGVETPLKSQMNAAFYYDQFIARYGMGRLHINLKLLADMIKEKAITPLAAQATQDKDTAALQQIGANEDIISAGREVSMIESKTGFAIVPYLEWRGTQIDRALLQSDVGAGDVGGSWTSAGTAVSAQELVALQSLRETLFNAFMAEIIKPRLPEFNIAPDSISIAAEPLSQIPVPYDMLVEMADRGIISEGEVRVRAGFDRDKPMDE